MGIDGDGALHLAYYSETSRNLHHATNATGSWETEVIKSDVETHGASLDIDVAGGLHVAYFDLAQEELRYATNVTGSWEVEVVEFVDLSSGLPSLGVDAGGSIHISYGPQGDLRYATDTTGSWETEIVDSEGRTGGQPSLGIDRDGAIHISYTDIGNSELKYATNATGAWETDRRKQRKWRPRAQHLRRLRTYCLGPTNRVFWCSISVKAHSPSRDRLLLAPFSHQQEMVPRRDNEEGASRVSSGSKAEG